jgi:hypothetical protein
MAGPGNNPVQFFSTGRANHWEFLRLWTGFELPSSWTALDLPCYGWIPHNAGFGFLDIAGPALGQIHF